VDRQSHAGYRAVAREDSIEIRFDVRFPVAIDDVADDLREIFYSIVVFDFAVDDTQQFAATVVQGDGSPVLQLIIDREGLRAKATEPGVEPIEKSVAVAAKQGCQGLIEIREFLLVDVYELRKG